MAKQIANEPRLLTPSGVSAIPASLYTPQLAEKIGEGTPMTGIGEVERGKLASGTEYIGFRDYGRETEIARNQALEFEAKRMQEDQERTKAKVVQDNTNYTYEYSPQQEKQLKELNNSWDTIGQGVAKGQYTAEQAQQLQRQIEIEKQAIRPQKVRRGPSPQEMFQSGQIVDPVTGVRLYANSKGEWTEVPGQPDQKMRAEYWKMAGNMRKTVKDSQGNEIEVPLTFDEQKRRVADMMGTSMQIGAATGGMQGQPGVATGGPSLDRPVTGEQLVQMQEQKQQEQPQVAQPREGQPMPTTHKTFADLSKEQQDKLLAKYREDERRRRVESELASKPIGGFAPGLPARMQSYAPMSEDQFIAEYNRNKEFARETGVFELRPGASPETIEDLGTQDKAELYSEYKRLNAGKRIMSKRSFEKRLEEFPEYIGQYLDSRIAYLESKRGK
jgi:hypothetical protein